MRELVEMLRSFKKRPLTPSDLQSVASSMRTLNLNVLELWRVSNTFNILFSLAKFQAYVIILAGLLWIPSEAYRKYSEDSSKKVRIAIYAPIMTAVLFTPLYLYRRGAKKMLSSLSYHLKDNKIEVLGWAEKKPVLHDLS